MRSKAGHGFWYTTVLLKLPTTINKKCKLIHNLLKLANTDETKEQTETAAADEHGHDKNALVTSLTNPKVAVLDGIVLVQKMPLKRHSLQKKFRPRFT